MTRFLLFSRNRWRFTLTALLALLPMLAFLKANFLAQPPAAPFDLRPGDHICLVGNTLPERMQHDGWLEAYFYSRFPQHNLAVRNLGFSADELTLRLRSANFGSPDQWLTACKADVIFAFFGYNESFAGQDGLANFEKDLDTYLKHLQSQKYNGRNPPRIVLFSPIAHENLHDRNLPDGAANNQRLALYTTAMAKVAKANNAAFVDLYRPTLQQYPKSAKPWTINGIHLNEYGDEMLARIIEQSLFAGAAPVRDAQALEKLRLTIVDRNFYWFNRYRTVDGYSIYGGRADLVFKPDNQTNRVVMKREMEILDQMTANRDKVVWSAAQGKETKADDDALPPFLDVKTNKPGPLAGGKHLFLDAGDESIQRMTVAKGMKVNVFASEKEFPQLTNPVQMSWDTRGRLWVAAWATYPHWKPGEPMNDKILIFEDTKGTGKADKMTVFADGLHCPTGFEFWNGGVLVAQAPYLVFLKDSKGGDKADTRVKILGGLDSADTHHTSNSFVLDPGGALYFQEGTFHHTQVETPYGPPERCVNAGVFRYEPRTQKFDVYVAYGFANPHGHVFDRWGQDFVIDGTGADPYHAALFSGHLDYPNRHARPPQLYNQKGIRPCPGMEILSSRHFPESMQGNLLVANVIGFQGILRIKIEDKDSSFTGVHQEPILSSTDVNFRPSDLRIGPDGAIYFIDWHNPIIGHMQHNLRDPSRDRIHGRIYRVTYEGRALLKSPKIAGEPLDKLLDLLKEPEDRVRYRTRIELTGRDSDQVVAAVKKWVEKLDAKDADYQHHLLEALWLHQSHNVVNVELLKRLLEAPDFRARAAATRVLCAWRDRVPESLAILKLCAADPHPRVRLEAVRAASFYRVPEAIEVVLIAMDHPSDIYLDFLRGETVKALDPFVKKSIATGKTIPFTTTAGARYFVKNVATTDLLKMPRNQAVFLELLFRKGVRDEFRQEALAGLAKLKNKSELTVLLDTVALHDEQAGNMEESVMFDLARLLTARPAKDLQTVRKELEKLAATAKTPLTRQLGFVALVAADTTVEPAWKLGTQSVRALEDLLHAMPLIRDPGQRSDLYPKVQPLLKGLPPDLAATVKDGKTIMGRYVRIELPGKKKTLTLAEVEVYSDGRNIARQGKATQKTTAFGGDAGRAIDGNKSGAYAAGGQTHTQENDDNPWWELDLGAAFPITAIAIYNRIDGDLGNRLAGFTLKVLDKDRTVTFELKKQPAPPKSVVYQVGGQSPERMVRWAAMTALLSVRGQETNTFKELTPFVGNEVDRHTAIQAMLRIPLMYWPKENARPLLDTLLTYVRKIPVKERTTSEVLDAVQMADSLASLLPLAEAKAVRKDLGALAVRVVRIGTVPDQMRFDKERLVVKAGAQAEILFENTDLMPHNLVVIQPGSLEEIGLLAEETATQPSAIGRHYVPTSSKVLFKSRLLQPRESEKLSFTAPSKPGVYPIVCTYPGHWRRMYGALYVVEDLDDYLADPTGYLAKHPLPIADELLKFTRPRTEWKFEDLASSMEKLEPGRSFANGKQMFQVANCLACHKMNGVGLEIGPDLTKIDPKQMKPIEILRDILEPSFRINEKYQSYVVEMKSGKVFTGLIVEETPQMVKLLENPLAKAAPLVLKVAEIDTRKKSPTSIMPKGLLDQLTRDEILDLVAYIASRGDPQHAVWQGGHEHGKKGL